jgi:hypothetical protein
MQFSIQKFSGLRKIQQDFTVYYLTLPGRSEITLNIQAH